MISLTCLVALTAIPWIQGAEVQCLNHSIYHSTIPGEIPPVLEKHEAALILLLGFGGLSIILAIAYAAIRRYVFDDANNLDSTFDAGGNVSASLTAVTLAAQLLWPADLMQSVTVVVKYGIAGVFWYCAAVLVNLSLFPLFSFKFKTKAPGAKTYLQIILARCGRVTHTVYCIFALLVNVVILSSIIVGGIAVLQATVKDSSPEFCILLLATLCGSYTFIGGLGSTFYVSYFNALTTFIVLSILVFNVFYLDKPPFGTLEEIYRQVNCLPQVRGNRNGSYFTFLSEGSMLWAVQGLFLVSSITYCDQSSWQSRIAAKPLQGAIGFLLASVIWFAVPATIGTVAGVTYLAKSAVDPTVHLTEDQINSGIVSAYMSQQALGKQGGVMMLTMLTMLTMSTGSGEIMGVASIIVYDIYQIYIRPFRWKLAPGSCTFCGLPDPKSERFSFIDSGHTLISQPSVELCKCPSPLTCDLCKLDLDRLKRRSEAPGKIVQYKCPYHGEFRVYQDSLINFNNWCILWITLGFVPFGLAIHASGVDLNWTMMTGIVITVPCFPGVILCILWKKATGRGLIIGCFVGLGCGVTSNLLVAFVYYQGGGGFILATSELYAVVAGSACAIFSSLVVMVSVSLCTHNIRSCDDELAEWQKMRDIDNPLHPWSLQFADDFPEVRDGTTRPTSAQLEHVSRHGRIASIAGSIAVFVIFILVIPGSMASLEVLSASEFKVWATVINIWCIVMAVVIVVVTPIEEVKAIVLQLKTKKKNQADKDATLTDRNSVVGQSRLTDRNSVVGQEQKANIDESKQSDENLSNTRKISSFIPITRQCDTSNNSDIITIDNKTPVLISVSRRQRSIVTRV